MAVELTRTVPDQLISEEEFEAWCDEDTRAEFVDGKVILMSPVAAFHDDLHHFLAKLIGVYLEFRPHGRVKGGEFQVRLRPGLRRVPDLLYFAQSREADVKRTYFQGAPDAVWEIVSPESEERDWRDKYLEYQSAGVTEYWLIDPYPETVILYRLHEGVYQAVTAQEGRLESAVIPGFWLNPEWLWRDPLPGALECLREMGVMP